MRACGYIEAVSAIAGFLLALPVSVCTTPPRGARSAVPFPLGIGSSLRRGLSAHCAAPPRGTRSAIPFPLGIGSSLRRGLSSHCAAPPLGARSAIPFPLGIGSSHVAVFPPTALLRSAAHAPPSLSLSGSVHTYIAVATALHFPAAPPDYGAVPRDPCSAETPNPLSGICTY